MAAAPAVVVLVETIFICSGHCHIVTVTGRGTGAFRICVGIAVRHSASKVNFCSEAGLETSTRERWMLFSVVDRWRYP